MPGDNIPTRVAPPTAGRGHVCPWWLGRLLASPVRRLLGSPERLLGPLVKRGMTVLEPGCGMGFFSLPMARLVGPEGKVICVDLQPQMIAGLLHRARRAGLIDRLEASVCTAEDLGVTRWTGRVDLAVALYTVHEVGDKERFLRQIAEALRPGGRLLFVEPRGHVSREAFAATLAAAERLGFSEEGRPAARRRLSAVLVRKDATTGNPR